MRVLYRALALLRTLFRRDQVDAGIADELRFHIDRETEANVAHGMTHDDAYRAARLKFGSVDDALETARDEQPGALLAQLVRDVCFAMRMLAKSPAFAISAATIIALGIGAVTAVFSVVYGVMLQPLPYRSPNRLVIIQSTSPSMAARLYPTAADAREWQRASTTLTDIALVRSSPANLNLLASGEAERLQGGRVTTNIFSVLGAAPARGRTFTDEESQDGGDHVVVLSDGLWRSRFAADTSIAGRAIQLNGERYTVIGVMPPDFAYPSREYQLWVPVVFDPRELTRETAQNYVAVGRLRDGAELRQAQLELATISQRLQREFPATNRDRTTLIEPMLDNVVSDIRPALYALLGASLCLLFIACLNLSNLLGGRAASRRSEFAVRLALGASRARLVRQAIAEVLPLLILGGTAGVLIAIVGVHGFVALSPAGVPRLETVAVSTPVVVASLVILALTGAIVSIAPAARAWQSDFTTIAKDGERSSTAGRRRVFARRFGVVAQIAAAVPLLVGANLLVRTSMRLATVDLGFAPGGVATFHVAVPRAKYATDAQVAAFYDRLLREVTAIPGVVHAGMANRLPLAGNQTMSIGVERAAGDVQPISAIDSRPVTPDYFAAMGIALREGRPFTDRDDANAAPVTIIDERLAREMWPGESAIGKRVQRFDDVWCTVIGVVGHIHTIGVDVDPRPQVYWSHHQVTQDRMVLVVRATSTPATLVKPVVDALHRIDADQPVYDVRTMDDVVDRSLVQRRLTMTLIAAFGAIALVLAAVGIYGVISYSVTQRGKEFGVRLALGATPGGVTRFVARDGLRMAITGCAAGLVAALTLSGAMSSLIFGVTSRDVVSFAGAAGALFAVALVASYLPARRAAAIDPAVTLRAE